MHTPNHPSTHWDVIAVFGADAEHSGFAYTSGLAPGHPELLVWARPTDGIDPGVDWSFTARALADLLNATARALLSGDLTLDAGFERTFDGGTSTVRLWFAGALCAPAYGTSELPHGTRVVPIRWQLERGKTARTAEVLPGRLKQRIDAATLLLEAEQQARDTARPLNVTSVPFEGAPSGNQKRAADDLFGPWTPVIERVRLALAARNAAGAAMLVGTLGSRGDYQAAASRAVATGERCGRGAYVHACVEAAVRDTRDVLTVLRGSGAADVAGTRSLLHAHYQDVLTAAYTTVAVADMLDAGAVAHGCGFVWAVCCPQTASRRFYRLVKQLHPQAFTAAIAASSEGDDVNFAWMRSVHQFAQSGAGAPLDIDIAAKATGIPALSWARHTRLVGELARMAALPWPVTVLEPSALP